MTKNDQLARDLEHQEDPFPHKRHNYTQWTIEPVAGFPRTVVACYDCGVFQTIWSGVKP